VNAPEGRQDYDAVVVGASLAGSATAIQLGRAGLRVALIEKRPDEQAYKRICTHYIQASAMPAIERLGLLEPMMQAGAVRSRARLWTRWGWLEPPPRSRVPAGVNLRRERLDPLVRRMAGETSGVDLILGCEVDELVGEQVGKERRVSRVQLRERSGKIVRLGAQLVIGADGRGSRVAQLAGVPTHTTFNGRFAYGGYFEGPAPAGAPDASLWVLDPHMAAVFPTDSGLMFYAAMPTHRRLEEFRADPERALRAFVANIPDAPPILDSRLVGQVQGKLDLTNVVSAPAANGVALVGDAALAMDPLWGVGCGWAFQSAEWLADSVAPALLGSEPLARGLRRYSRRYSRALRGHIALLLDSATGRRMNVPERISFSTGVRDERAAATLEAFGTRSIGPARMIAEVLPRSLAVRARDAFAPGRGGHARNGGHPHKPLGSEATEVVS
jgi:2-polyprenyl-6-methoxyphenol hydroxylase-like FAD-dependent oxidoreductase